LDVSLEAREGRELLDKLSPHDAKAKQLIGDAKREFDRSFSVAALLSEELAHAASASDTRCDAIHSIPVPVTIDRKRARAGAWYEMVPRSQGTVAGQHGTFADCIARLPEIAALGFD